MLRSILLMLTSQILSQAICTVAFQQTPVIVGMTQGKGTTVAVGVTQGTGTTVTVGMTQGMVTVEVIQGTGTTAAAV
ncbi:hypothetical protein RSA36_22005, partial [Pantoea stewartii]